MHYFKFNIGDWVLSTQHLTALEEGVYFRLIRHYYATEQPIPIETHSVIRRLRLAGHEKTVEIILEEFFKKTSKGWIQKRCDKEVKIYKKRAETNKANGNKSAGRPISKGPGGLTDLDSENKPSGLIKDTPKNEMVTLTTNQELVTTNDKPLTKDLEDIFQFWKKTMGKTNSVKFNETLKAKVRNRLKGGFSKEQIIIAIKGNAGSPWHQGQNDRNKKYNSLELICRNDEKTQTFLEMALQDQQTSGQLETWLTKMESQDELGGYPDDERDL
jgi:uncharacterized protein YdaU (DUF1376 family)